MKKLAIVMLFALAANATTFLSGQPSTTNDDDSCDIALMPAATLLLPYFEVDVAAPQSSARTTLFTLVNTAQSPQIAHVTLWTDWGYPVIDFNVFLTGYDVQAINLYDILARSVIAPPNGTSSEEPPGNRSLPNTANPNFSPNAMLDCALLPGAIPASLVGEMRAALTTGVVSSCGTTKVGGAHANAAGYVTIDVVKSCIVALPNTIDYFNDLLYDNALTGDYQIINPNPVTGNYASGNPMVHIRAIPEGGAAGAIVATDLPYTFYDRYTPRATPAVDRRQPLPAAFSARFIQGGPGAFNTELQIWREGITGPQAACAGDAQNAGAQMTVADVVRFDEHENPVTTAPPCPNCTSLAATLPETSSTPTQSPIFPVSSTPDLGGWMYLDLDNAGSNAYSTARHSQNWVVVSMSAEGRLSTAFDATMLANGCTAAPASGAPIGPGPNSVP